MAFINFATKTAAIKIVYYGPGLSGKTTNLRYIYFKLDSAYRGDFVCLETEAERTYFFDLLPIKAGLIGDFKVHFQLMTVPGQVFYEASRKSVLKGSDGLIFVADSQTPLLDANLESFDGLRRNCLEDGIDLNTLPMVFQYNKRDLPNLIPVETLDGLLNPRHNPRIEAVALNGVGVFESLREIAKLTVPAVRETLLGKSEDDAPDRDEASRERIDELRERSAPAAPAASSDDIPEFVHPAQAAPIEEKRMKLKSQRDIEQELDRLSQEFISKGK